MYKQLTTLLSTILLFTAGAALAQGIADTQENRQAQAERYLQATPPKALFEDMAKKTAVNLPVEQRETFVRIFTSHLDMDVLVRAMTDAIVKHFTAEEIKALADFYGSPVGKSAMSKFGDYMAEIMPVIQAETIKAQMKANQSLPGK